MESWETSFKTHMVETVNEGIQEWVSLVNQLGLPENYVIEWTNSYKQQMKELQNELNSELIGKRAELINEIESLLKKSQKFCKELGTAMPDFGCKNLGLYGEHQELNEHVDKLQKKWDKRMREVKVLIKEEKDLCKTLERKQMDISADSCLPPSHIIDDLKQYIKDLEQEKYDRTEKFIHLKCECVELVQKLKCRPKGRFEKSIINGNDISFVVSQSNLEQLEDFRHTLLSEMSTISEKLSHLQRQVKGLWRFLEEDQGFCDAFMEKHREVNNETLRVFEREFSRCEEKIRANREITIQKMRYEIRNLWEKCLYSDTECSKFRYINDDVYTDDLIELHVLELHRLEKYYEENKELLKLINVRVELWSQMLELDEKEGNPNRLKNRGGQLLLEEKKRKAVPKKLLKIEEKILQMASEYEKNNGKKFMCWGESIEEVIMNSRTTHEQTKKLKLSARKQNKSLTPSNSQLRTPSSCKTQTGNKLKIHRTPNTVNSSSRSTTKIALFSERRPQTSYKENKPARVIPKVQLNGRTICKTKISFSTERKKRAEKFKRISRILKKNNTSVWAEYNDFKNLIPIEETTIDLVP